MIPAATHKIVSRFFVMAPALPPWVGQAWGTLKSDRTRSLAGNYLDKPYADKG